MSDDQVRDDIAFIRSAIEDGRAYATARGLDMVVWGLAVALGYGMTYARVRGWTAFNPDWVWAACIGLPWLYSLRRLPPYLLGRTAARPAARPITRALRTLWLGCGIALSLFAAAAYWTGDQRQGWISVFAAAVLGIGFFTSASLANLAWLRLVAYGWWLGFIAVFFLRDRIEVLPLSAALMLLLLALPGLLLCGRRSAAAGSR